MKDFRVTYHGSICLVHSDTKRAQRWIAEHVNDEAQFMGFALAVEPRYIENLREGMILDGLEEVH